MTQISRRDFLAQGVALGAAVPLSDRIPPRAPPAQDNRSPGPVTVFSKHLQWLDYDELADVVAEAGFDGIDLTVRPGGHVEPERVDEELPRAVQAARRVGLSVPMITTAITRARDPISRRVLAAASAQEVGFYRTGYLRYPDDTEPRSALDGMRSLLRQLAELNQEYDIHGGYQNHSGTGVGGPVWDLSLLLEGIDPRWLGVQYDIAHATVEGGMAWPLGLRLLASHVRTLDFKDFLWHRREDRWVPRWVPLGEGMVDYPRFLRLVRELRVGGPVSVHFEYPPLEGPNPLAPAERRREAIELMRRDLERVRALMAEAGLESADGRTGARTP